MTRSASWKRKLAQGLLCSAYFFRRFLKDVRRAGLVGEERNALVVYVAATSRLLPEPIALFVKGPSSIGKNFLADAVLRFFPAGEVSQVDGVIGAILELSTRKSISQNRLPERTK